MSTGTVEQSELVARTLKINLWLGDEHKELRQRILSSIRQYRGALRKCYSILSMAQAAGADLTWDGDNFKVTPNNERAQVILAGTLEQDGKALGYQFRRAILQEECPTFMSFVWDSLRRDLATAWIAKDPEFTNARRGWLTLQGSRGIAQFNNRGIGFPMATGRPKFGDHVLTLKWDREIDKVDFRFAGKHGGRLNPEAWRTYKAIRDGEYEPGTVFLSERDGELFSLLTHSRPQRRRELDVSRACQVTFQGTGDTLLTIAGPDGEDTFETIDSAGVLGWLNELRAARLSLERRRGAYGSPSRPWGHRRGWLKAQQVLNGYTIRRERGVGDHNHRWSARIVTRAVAWRCGKVVLSELPENISGHPWNWSGLKDRLKYKCEEVGIAFECG